jgi:Cdc6-like AAA superfamily ATPase
MFFGRDSELQDLVTILKQDEPARIAILGIGGMGKTTLATAVINHGDVVAKYPQRYFVGCQSTAACHDVVASIASHIGLDKGPNLARKLVRHLSSGPATFLVLDNLETVWEPASTRNELEEFLSLLADVPQLALMVSCTDLP